MVIQNLRGGGGGEGEGLQFNVYVPDKLVIPKMSDYFYIHSFYQSETKSTGKYRN